MKIENQGSDTIQIGNTTIHHPSKAETPVAWPKERNFTEIETLYKFPLSMVFFKLPTGAKILDVGCGDGNVEFQSNIIWSEKKLKFFTITTTKVKSENLHYFEDINYAYVPEDVEYLEKNKGLYYCILDTYASLTYAKNPLHALIYLSLLLAPKGQLLSMSSMVYGDSENSCFGNSETREEIKIFFKEKLGIDLEFDLVKIKSKACKPGEEMDDLRIHLKVSKQGVKLSPEHQQLNTTELFKSLCRLADKKIGISELMQGKTGFTAGQYHITPRCYKRALNENLPPVSNKKTKKIAFWKPWQPEKTHGIFGLTKITEKFGPHTSFAYNSTKYDPLDFQRHAIQEFEDKIKWHHFNTCNAHTWFEHAHLRALCRLMREGELSAEEALAELKELTATQALYIFRGLTREEVLAFTDRSTPCVKFIYPLEILAKYKSRGLTLEILQTYRCYNWLLNEDTLKTLNHLITLRALTSKQAIDEMYSNLDPIVRISYAFESTAEKKDTKLMQSLCF